MSRSILIFGVCCLFVCGTIVVSEEPTARPDGQNLESRIKRLEEQITNLTEAIAQLRREQSQPTSRESITRSAQTLTTAGDETLRHQLDGTWRYISAIESDRICTYEKTSMELVISGEQWGIVIDGGLDPHSVETVNFQADHKPIRFVRHSTRNILPGGNPQVANGILKVDGEHLLYTTTFLMESQTLFPGGSNPQPRFPESFSPEGTHHVQYVLRRVSDSTKLLTDLSK